VGEQGKPMWKIDPAAGNALGEFIRDRTGYQTILCNFTARSTGAPTIEPHTVQAPSWVRTVGSLRSSFRTTHVWAARSPMRQ
jgi:hypothetical protein